MLAVRLRVPLLDPSAGPPLPDIVLREPHKFGRWPHPPMHPFIATPTKMTQLPKMASSGTVYHTLFKTPSRLHRTGATQARQRLNDFEKFAKRNKIDSLVLKIVAPPGLIYAESGDLPRLQVFTTEVQRQSRGARTFTPVVPPMEAPVYAQARLSEGVFSKVTDVEGMDTFGTEMINRGLEYWWINVERQQLFSARS